MVTGSYTVADPDGRIRTVINILLLTFRLLSEMMRSRTNRGIARSSSWISTQVSQVTYTDDGSGFVAHVTYDGAIGPPAIPLNDGASTIPSQEDQLVSPSEPLQPVHEPASQDLDVIIAKGQQEEEEGEVDVEDENPRTHNLFRVASQLPVLPRVHLDQQHAQHVHQEGHQLHLDHNQLHALHLLQPPVPVLRPSSLFDTEPAAILARGKNPPTPNLTSPTRSKEAARVTVVVRRRPVQRTNLLQRQPLDTLQNHLDLSQFTLLGVGRVLG